jgi:nucleotide-binding universal stress UspA family protein
MYTKILVPLDGSELAEGVLPYVRSLAGELKLPVTLLQVIDPETISIFSAPHIGRYFDTVAAALKDESNAYLKKVAYSLATLPKVDCAIEMGQPPETIVAKAAEDRGILIAMATHGRSGIQRWIMGSVADKVLHATSNHLLLVRPRGEPTMINQAAPIKSIVIPLDGSGLAETILPHAIELAQKLEAEIILLRAYTLPASIDSITDEYVPNFEELNAQLRSEAKDYLDAKVQELKGKGIDKVSGILVAGHGAAEIIDFAKKTPDNIVAMCTHGRSGVGRWVLGSVTERVVKNSGDPVLVIRAPS